MRVGVIGAGISGLVAAWDLMRQGVEVILLEASDRAGGVIGTRKSQGYQFDTGPVLVHGAAPALHQLLRDLDMTGSIQSADASARYRHLYFHGSLKALPTTMDEFRKSRLFTLPQKLRILLEPFVPKASKKREMNVAEFFGRRFGRSISMTWIDVLVSEVYGGNPNRLGIESAFPAIARMVAEHGSVLRAMKARAKQTEEDLTRGKSSSVFSLRGGFETLPLRLAEDIGSSLHLHRKVKQVTRRQGGGLALATKGESGDLESIDVDRLVMAVDAAQTGVLLAPLAPEVADLLFEVETSPLVVVLAGFDQDQLPGLPPGFGFLVPRCVRMRTLGWTFVSKLFPDRAPEGKVGLTGFIGGILDPHAVDVADSMLAHLMMGELALALSQRKMPKPEYLEVLRWTGCLPQYNVGHNRRMEAVRTFVSMEAPEVSLAGNWVGGISVESCVARARQAAGEILAARGGEGA